MQKRKTYIFKVIENGGNICARNPDKNYQIARSDNTEHNKHHH